MSRDREVMGLSLIGSVWVRLGRLALAIARRLPGGRVFAETADTQVPADLGRWFCQRVLGINSGAYWPMHPTSRVTFPRRVHIGVETSPGWSAGCYVNGMNGIYIGDYTQIAPNVGIISANHDSYYLPRHLPSPPIRIGRYCLLGFGSVILPGVELGDFTIVAANAVVASSFPDGRAVLAGSPARVVKQLDPAKCEPYRSAHEYNGYVPAARFPEFAKQRLALPDVTDRATGDAAQVPQ